MCHWPLFLYLLRSRDHSTSRSIMSISISPVDFSSRFPKAQLHVQHIAKKSTWESRKTIYIARENKLHILYSCRRICEMIVILATFTHHYVFDIKSVINWLFDGRYICKKQRAQFTNLIYKMSLFSQGCRYVSILDNFFIISMTKDKSKVSTILNSSIKYTFPKDNLCWFCETCGMWAR